MDKSKFKFAAGSSSDKAKSAYVPLYALSKVTKNITLGMNTTAILMTDPKLVLFTLSKYKFAGKLLRNRKKVLEVGCMDGFGSLLLESFVKELVSIDFYSEHIQQAKKYILPYCDHTEFLEMDFLDSKFIDCFDGLVCFDVLEHIDPRQSQLFIDKLHCALKPGGIAIIGMPSLESQVYASKVNKDSHINCMTQRDGIKALETQFSQILPFSMNDEVVHTGFEKMAHYHIYVCYK